MAAIQQVLAALGGAGGGGGATNPTFANVEALIHMAGADGSTSFTDSSSNAHTVTTSGNAQVDTADFPSGIGTGALLLDGSGDYISLPITSMNMRTATWNIGFWVKRPSGGATQYMVHFGSDGADLYVQLVSGALYLGDGITNNLTAGTVTDSVWHWIEVCFDGTTYSSYIDDVLGQSSTTLLKTTTTTLLRLGYRSGVGGYMTGSLADFRLTVGESGPFGVPTTQHPDS